VFHFIKRETHKNNDNTRIASTRRQRSTRQFSHLLLFHNKTKQLFTVNKNTHDNHIISYHTKKSRLRRRKCSKHNKGA